MKARETIYKNQVSLVASNIETHWLVFNYTILKRGAFCLPPWYSQRHYCLPTLHLTNACHSERHVVTVLPRGLSILSDDVIYFLLYLSLQCVGVRGAHQ